jgi:acyl-CoA hydrolase
MSVLSHTERHTTNNSNDLFFNFIRSAMLKLSKRLLFTHRKQAPPVLSSVDAVKLVKSNDRIYMHGVAAFPSVLADALLTRQEELLNIEINHVHIERDNPLAHPPFHINNYFIGKNQRELVAQGVSSLIPCFLSELPKLMRKNVRR